MMKKGFWRTALCVLGLAAAVWLVCVCCTGMSGLFLHHFIFTVLMAAAVWGVYAYFTVPAFRRMLSFRDGQERKRREESTFNSVVLMRWMLGVAFVSIAVLFWFVSMRETGRNDWFTSIFAGIMNAGWSLSFGAPLFEIWDYMEKVGLVMTSADRAWLAIVVGFSPLLTLTTAATLFRLPKFWWMLRPFARREICIFSDLNERAQKYANAIRNAHMEKPPHVVFCSDGKVDLVDTAAIVGPSLVLKQNVCRLILPRYAMRRISFYLVTDDDNMIIEQTILLHEKYRRSGCHINCVTPASLNEHVVDQLNRMIKDEDKQEQDEQEKAKELHIGFTRDGQIDRSSRNYARTVQASFIDVINEAIRTVYHSLHVSEQPLINRQLLEAVAPDHQPVTLRALVLGAGSVGEEIVRTLLWYCQAPGASVEVTVAGKETADIIRGRIFRRNMRFEEHLASIGYGDKARIVIRPEIDLRSDKLEALLEGDESRPEYHFIFVATGDDNQNYQLALRVRRHYLRNPMPWGCPDIRAVIWDDTVTGIIQQERIQALMGVAEDKCDERRYTDYGLLFRDGGKQLYHPACSVTLMGAMEETLDTLHRLEYDALRYHAHYSGVSAGEMKTEGIPRRVYYEYYASSESDKRSNWAVAIHGRVKAEWLYWQQPKTEGEKQKLLWRLAHNEHVRWCIFKLLEGDCPIADEDTLADFLAQNEKGRDEDTIRGYHVTLRRWSGLKTQREKAVADDTAYNGKPREKFWKDMVSNNIGLAEFSLALNPPKE